MPAGIEIGLAGPLAIRDAAGDAITGLSRRGQALLAYLARQSGMRAERGLLADLLWSDRAEAQARASLRQELSMLRRALPDAVLGTDRQSVWLDPARVTVDTGGGEFLQGFDLASEGFEDWLRQERSAGDGDLAGAPAPARDRPSLAVLAFDELGAAEGDFFADGVVEEITGALSRVREFHVIARQSAFALRGERLDVPSAAARLGADYVVEGSVRRSGERVRIAVQLAAGSDGRTLWSERFDDRLDDLFDLQDRIAAQVAGQLSPSLRAAEIARAGSTRAADRTGYELMLTAYPHFWALRRDDNIRAGALLDAALDHDPGLVAAMALRSWVHAQQTTYMWALDPAAERTRALELAGRAAERAGDHAPTLVAIAGTYSQTGNDRDLAQAFLHRTLDLDPNNAWAWIRQGWLHMYFGETQEAEGAFDRAEGLSPLDPFLHQITFGRAATRYRWDDDPSEGLRMIEAGLRRHPGVVWPLRMLAAGYARLGDRKKARSAAKLLMHHLPHLSVAYLREALPPVASGWDDAYFELLAKAGIPLE